MERATPADLRRTKLVCTVGPASVDRLPELVRAGMDVARINFSHGTAASHAEAAGRLRDAAAGASRVVGLLVDLPGPKVRLGELEGGEVTLEAGRPFVLRPGSSEDGDDRGAAVTYAGLAGDVRAGDRILLADGAAELRVTSVRGDDVETEVVRGGRVRSRAGVALPAERLSMPALTDDDIADLPRAVALGADFIAQSFVRSAQDVRDLRAHLGPDGPAIVAKIETRPAVDAFDAILLEADAVMIARGDLGVELPYEEVPLVQKDLVGRTLAAGVPSIVATQMLESMTQAPRPTRAEASDVANAVFDGADAIMLSAETAIGAFPVLAAQAAVAIAERCEADGSAWLPTGRAPDPGDDASGLAYAAVALARTDRELAAIACYTRTGRTARILSGLRPPVPILAFTPDPGVARGLAIHHGVVARSCDGPGSGSDRLGLLESLVASSGALPPGSPVVLVASTAAPGTGPNRLEVHRIPR